MKKLGIFLFIIFFFITAFYAILQSALGRNFVRKQIIQAAQSSGYQISIERLKGTLPHQITLEGVKIQSEEVDITIQKIQLRPILWRLLEKELAFTDVHAKKISISGKKPFNFDGKFRISQTKASLKGELFGSKVKLNFYRQQRSINIAVNNPLFDLKARASLDSNFHPLFADLQLSSDQILEKLPNHFHGRLLASAHIVKKEKDYQAQIVWQIPNFQVEDFPETALHGKGEANFKNAHLTGQLNANDLAKAVFDLEIDPHFQGSASIEISDLDLLHVSNVHGNLKVDLDFQEQRLSIQAQSSDLRYESLHLTKVDLIAIQGEKLWTFSAQAEGELREPIRIDMRGIWNDTFTISALSGKYGKTPFSLIGPSRMIWTSEIFKIHPTELSIEEGNAIFELNHDHSNTDGSIRASNIPLDLFALNSNEKTFNLEAKIQKRNENLSANFNASIQDTAHLKGSFEKNLLNVLFSSETSKFNLSIPLSFSLFPFHAQIQWSKQAKADLKYDGKIEEFLDFFNLKEHRLTGDCHADLHFKNTLKRPLVSGNITIENGFYENYYTGTILKDLSAKFLAEKNTLFLQELKAIDEPESGKFEATGHVDLFASDHYPFQFRAHFKNLKFVQIDLVEATAEGSILIEGNTLSSIAKGDVLVTKSELTIPNHIPKPLPNLQVVYRNATQLIIPPQKEKKPYPLFLDLAVSAPQISITGRGLNSQWKGDFHLGGTYTALSTQGKIDLVKGEFSFSSRSFHLTEGSLFFSGKEHQMPHLNLSGTMQVKGITIIATLHGALDNPQITLQSSPPLPLGSIMSYLLFGQDISEIGGFQALQIASSLASLAGTSPDVMENTRRSLGVDRLRVMTDDNGDSVSLQVGKYVSEGVLVSFTQGTDESSVNISVEIELKNNFVFQIESDQRQEQGRFTFKWNLNY